VSVIAVQEKCDEKSRGVSWRQEWGMGSPVSALRQEPLLEKREKGRTPPVISLNVKRQTHIQVAQPARGRNWARRLMWAGSSLRRCLSLRDAVVKPW
jgi:hypothetical protein